MSNLGWPVRIVESGGIPVTEAANGLGAPYVEADNGVAVTFVESGGYPLTTGGQWWRSPKHKLDGAPPLAVLSPASGRSMLNGRAVNDNALISRQGGIKYVVGADGVLAAVPANTLAYDWSSGVRELLFEGAATNLLTFSATLSGISSSRVVLTSGHAGPTGALQAIRATTTGETDPIVTRNVAQSPSGLTITFSVWLRCNSPNGNALKARFLTYGSTGTEQAQATDATITSEWRRYSHTRTFPVGMVSTSFTVRVDPFDGSGGSETPIAGGSIDIDYWQVETGSVASSYIPTVGATVTRQTDVAPLWANAGDATAWAWRGVVPVTRPLQQILGATGGPYLESGGADPTLLRYSGYNPPFVGNGSVLPSIIGSCFGWGTSGSTACNFGKAVEQNALTASKARTVLSIGSVSGMQLGQVLRLRELVAWQLPDRPSAAGCQSQARLWSA